MDQVSIARLNGLTVFEDSGNVDAVPLQHFRQIQPVDGAKAVETMQARYDAFILNVRQPAETNDVVQVTMFFCYQVTGLLDLALAEAQLFTDALQFEAGVHASSKERT